jgi:hypothetical protein
VEGEGFIGGGHLATTDAKGNIYVAATGQGMQRLTFRALRPTCATPPHSILLTHLFALAHDIFGTLVGSKP